MASESHHERIKRTLIRRLQSYPLETRLPSFRELAREMNVAYLTISSVMKQLEWEGYIRRVPRKGSFLASRERTVHRDPQTGTCKLETVVFAYPNYFSYATWTRLQHAEEQAVKGGLALVEYKMNPEATYDRLRDLVHRRGDVAGIILIPVPNTVTRDAIDLLDSLGVPVVLLSHCDYVSAASRVWSVTTDDYRTGQRQARLLIDAGHRRIAFVRHEPFNTDRQQMLLKGMRQAIRDAGLKQRDLVVVGGSTRPWQDSRRVAEDLTAQLLADRRVTGAVYESLRGVQGGLKAAADVGARVPDDLAIVSTGRGNGDEDYLQPPVTTVDPQADAEIDMAFQCLRTPRQQVAKRLTVEPVTHMRQSVADAPATVVSRQVSADPRLAT